VTADPGILLLVPILFRSRMPDPQAALAPSEGRAWRFPLRGGRAMTLAPKVTLQNPPVDVIVNELLEKLEPGRQTKGLVKKDHPDRTV